MAYMMVCWREKYAIFEQNEQGRPVGQPIELCPTGQIAAARVRELNSTIKPEKRPKRGS